MDTSACIKLNNLHTDWFNTENGVRQGDCLSPTLFAIFVNDLAVQLKNLNLGVEVANEKICLLMYADDIVLLTDSEEDMQVLLNKLGEWCNQWRLRINMNKSEVLHVRCKRKARSNFLFKLNGSVLNYTSQYKYLGLLLNEHMDFNITTKLLADSAASAHGRINSKFKGLNNMGFSTYEKLFNTSILPILNYGAEIWGAKGYNHVQQVQSKAMRFYLGVHKFAPTLGLFGDTGWFPIINYQKLCMLRFWNRLVKTERHRLLYKIFCWDYNLSKMNWCSEIKSIFEELDIEDHFINKKCCNIDQANNLLNSYI